MRRALAFVLCLACLPTTSFAGLGNNKSMYVGGTAAGMTQGNEGQLVIDTPDAKAFSFSGAGNWSLTYGQVTSLEYGQHAGRRIGHAIAVGLLTYGIGGLLAFSKKRRHYLTIGYTDSAGAQQAAIFEIGKDAIRTTIKSLEVRTGKKVEYEDDEARKAGNK